MQILRRWPIPVMIGEPASRGAPVATGMITTANGNKINLIMGGGDVRLSAYVRALAAFHEMGVTFGAVAGASAGSIVGSLLAAGWPVDRIYQASPGAEEASRP